MNLIETYNGSGFYAQYATSADYASNGTPLSAALTSVPDTYLQNTDLEISDNKITGISGIPLAAGGGGDVPTGIMVESGLEYDNTEISGYSGSAFKDVALTDVVTANSGAWGGSALPISAGPGISLGIVDNNLLIKSNISGYVWQSASLFYTATPVKNTTYVLSDDCSNYDKLEVDFYDINNWRTQMDCPIPPNLDASGTRGGYFSVVPASTATGASIWFKAFNWTAAGTTWSCYCSELAGQGGSTTQTINANQPDNPPKVIQIIGWKRVEV